MKLVWKAAAGATHYLVTFSYPGGEERIEKTFTSDIHLKDLVPNSIYDIKVVGMNANTAGMPYLQALWNHYPCPKSESRLYCHQADHIV